MLTFNNADHAPASIDYLRGLAAHAYMLLHEFDHTPRRARTNPQTLDTTDTTQPLTPGPSEPPWVR